MPHCKQTVAARLPWSRCSSECATVAAAALSSLTPRPTRVPNSYLAVIRNVRDKLPIPAGGKVRGVPSEACS